MAKTKKEAIQSGELTIINVPPIETKTIDVYVTGTSPLVMNKWSEKARKMMRDKQMGAAQQKREFKVPEDDFRDAIHTFADGRYGFPTIGFKAAAVEAVISVGGVKKTQARQAFHFNGDLAEIVGAEPEMREDMVRLQGLKADIRYRPAFFPWYSRLSITFNTRAITADQVLNLINTAGFAVGVGEWRITRNGGMGRFRVATEEEIKLIDRLLKKSPAEAAARMQARTKALKVAAE